MPDDYLNSLRRSRRLEEQLWEYFHENSKQTHYDQFPQKEVIFEQMKSIDETLTFSDYPIIDLEGQSVQLSGLLDEALVHRKSSRNISHRSITLSALATILLKSYGTTGRIIAENHPRTPRTVPSAGALYPIDIFLFANNVENLDVGLYHYCPVKKGLHPLNHVYIKEILTEGLVQQKEFSDVPVLLFFVASFGRTIFKYGQRGYRFVFLDSGHIAQNINLVATSLGLASCNICGYYDNKIDDALSLDGINQSVIYIIAIGYEQKE
jgi:SagB-type dehydrogenase family enzyme